MRSEVEAALKKRKRNKAAGPDEIVTEMLISLDNFGKEKLTEIINGMYDSRKIPGDLSRSIFIALPKKPGTRVRALSNHQPHEPHSQTYTEDYNAKNSGKIKKRNWKRTMRIYGRHRYQKRYIHGADVVRKLLKCRGTYMYALSTTLKHLTKFNTKN